MFDIATACNTHPRFNYVYKWNVCDLSLFCKNMKQVDEWHICSDLEIHSVNIFVICYFCLDQIWHWSTWYSPSWRLVVQHNLTTYVFPVPNTPDPTYGGLVEDIIRWIKCVWSRENVEIPGVWLSFSQYK